MSLFALAAAALLVAYLATRTLIRVAPALGLRDAPAAGKIHTRPVPTAGGLAIVLAFLLSVWAYHLGVAPVLPVERLLGLTVAGLIVTGLGLWDDTRGTTAWGKLAVEAAAAVVLYLAGFQVVQITNPFGDALALGWLAGPVTVLWLLVVTNAVNVIDGLDGLAAGVVAIGAITLGLIAWRFEETAIVVLASLLAAATLGFLPLNSPPARIFLGDTGSLALGFLMGGISLLENRKGTVAVTLLLPIVLLAIPLLDSALAFGRRVRQGRHPFARDTEHLHHRLLRLGLMPRHILTLVYGLCVCLGLAAGLISLLPKQLVALVAALLGTAGLVALRALAYFERAARHGRPPTAPDPPGPAGSVG